MSMIVTTVVPDGIVMAADSSLLTFKMIDLENFIKGNIQEAVVNTARGTCAYNKDNIVGNKFLSKSINKLHIMKGNNIAISDGNQRNLKNNTSIVPYLNYFCNNNHFNDPNSCAVALLSYIKNLSPNIAAVYYVCGYNTKESIPVPEFWYVDVSKNMVINALGDVQYGLCFSGANAYFSQYMPLINKNISSYSLQDAIDVTLFAFEMSIKLERFIDREELISPPIDLLVIEPDGVKWIQQKTLKGK